MAIKPATQYPGQSVAPSGNYPEGSAINVSTPGAGDGTPWEQAGINDIWGFLQGLLLMTSITATGVVDTALVSQYRDAVRDIALTGTNPITTENDAVSPLIKLTAKAGSRWDSLKIKIITLTSDITKDISLPWVPGDGNGGLPATVTLVDQAHFFVIQKLDGTIDAGWDTAINCANLLAASGFLFYVRVCTTLVTGPVNIVPTSQIGNEFHLANIVLGSEPTVLTPDIGVFTTLTLPSIPRDIEVTAFVTGVIENATTTAAIFVKSTVINSEMVLVETDSTGGADTQTHTVLVADTNAQIEYKAVGGGTKQIKIRGWRDDLL